MVSIVRPYVDKPLAHSSEESEEDENDQDRLYPAFYMVDSKIKFFVQRKIWSALRSIGAATKLLLLVKNSPSIAVSKILSVTQSSNTPLHLYLTIIPRAHVGYEMIIANEARSVLFRELKYTRF